MYKQLAKAAGKIKFLRKGSASEELKESCSIIGIDPNDTIALSRLVLIIGVLASLVSILTNIIYTGLIMVATLVLSEMSTYYAKVKAQKVKIEMASEFPQLVVQLVVLLKQNSNLERAIMFIIKNNEGKIVNELKSAMKNMWLGEKVKLSDVLKELSDKWGTYNPGIKRSIYLILSSFSESGESRENTLDKAVSTLLDSVYNQMKEYAYKLVLPSLMLFGIGTVIPMVIVSLLPIISLYSKADMLLYTTLLLTGSLITIVIYTLCLSSRRPPTFDTVYLPKRSKKIILREKEFGVIYSVALGIIAGSIGIMYLLSLLPWIGMRMIDEIAAFSLTAGVAVPIIVYSYGTSRRNISKIRKSREMEEEIVDSLYQIGSRLMDGRSLEDSIRFVSDTISSSVKSVLKSTFLSMRGKRSTYNRNVDYVLAMLKQFKNQGHRALSKLVFTISEYISKMSDIKKKTKEMLQKSLSMIDMTTYIFMPIVAGVAVFLQGMIAETLSSVPNTIQIISMPKEINMFWLETVLGLYIIAVGTVLTKFSATVSSKTQDEFKYELSKKLTIALFIYGAMLLISKIMVGVI